jgi:RNA polymerase sigma-70 factor (ECF subfamily)
MADARQPVEPTASANGSEMVALFLANQARIFAFIVSLVPNRADAEDLLQETGLTVHHRFAEYTAGTNFLAWSCQIAYYKVLDFRKREGRSLLQFDTEFVEIIAQQELEDLGRVTARHAALLRCLEKLAAKDRELVERCYRPNANIKAIAGQLHRPTNTVYKRLQHLRSVLFDCITRTLMAEGHS